MIKLNSEGRAQCLLATLPDTEEWRTAVHEAGHAVVALETDFRFRYVTIVPDHERGSLGHLAHHPDPRSFRPDVQVTIAGRGRLEKHIMLALAGFAAEVLVFGTGCAPKLWEADRNAAVDCAQYMSGSSEECSAYLAWLQLRTDNLLRGVTGRRVLDALAKALIQRRRLSYKEAVSIGIRSLVCQLVCHLTRANAPRRVGTANVNRLRDNDRK